MATRVKPPYREELIRLIKEAGQDLIDRAEEMVGENLDMITDFSINIYFPQGEIYTLPEISWTTETVSKNSFNRIVRGE